MKRWLLIISAALSLSATLTGCGYKASTGVYSPRTDLADTTCFSAALFEDGVKKVSDSRIRGDAAVVIETEEDDVRGINTNAQLADTESALQQRLRKAAMEAGVTLVAPGEAAYPPRLATLEGGRPGAGQAAAATPPATAAVPPGAGPRSIVLRDHFQREAVWMAAFLLTPLLLGLVVAAAATGGSRTGERLKKS